MSFRSQFEDGTPAWVYSQAEHAEVEQLREQNKTLTHEAARIFDAANAAALEKRFDDRCIRAQNAKIERIEALLALPNGSPCELSIDAFAIREALRERNPDAELDELKRYREREPLVRALLKACEAFDEHDADDIPSKAALWSIAEAWTEIALWGFDNGPIVGRRNVK